MADFSTIQNAESADIKSLELLAKQVVEGFIIGLHRSPFHGFSVEFAEHRLYNPGDNSRNIDWKVYARTDRLYSKRYEEETNLRCQIVIDTSSSMYLENEKKRALKMEFSCKAAAALCELLQRQRDAFGLSLFDETLHFQLQARSGNVHKQFLYSKLEQCIKERNVNKKTSTAQCLHQIADSIHKRSLVIIFSDMLSSGADETLENSSIWQALRHLRHAKHEVILFHVSDTAKEIEFDFPNRPYVFVDLESGEQIKLNASQIKEQYKTAMNAYLTELKTQCGLNRIDLMEADVRQDLRSVLTPYLLRRARMRA